MLHRNSAILLAGLLAPAALHAQGEPEYYAKPVSVADFWKAVKFETSVGKFELAGQYIKALLDRNPTDEELLAIEAKDGMAPLLRLRLIPVWNQLTFPNEIDPGKRRKFEEDAAAKNAESKKNVETLIEKVSGAIKNKFGDPQRIAKFAKTLNASREEAAYAERELYRAGSAAIPVLVTLMREDQDLRVPIREAMSRLDLSTVPAVLAALEIPDARLQIDLLASLRDRGDYPTLPATVETDPLPILNYFSSNLASIPPAIRERATSMREGLAVVDPKDALLPELNSSQGQLWKAAKKLYDHKARFRDVSQVSLWTSAGAALASKPGTVSDAEEFFGLKYLRWALQIQPDFLPAQELFLKLAIEKQYQRTGLDKPLNETTPQLHELLVGAPYELLTDLLGSSIAEQKSGVALAVLQAIADRGDPRAIAASVNATDHSRKPSLLEQALNHPDFRVQLLAATTILKIANKTPVASDAVVKILAQAVRAGVDTAQKGKPTALIGDFDQLRALALANLVRKAGFEVEWIKTGKDLLRRMADNSNVEVVILDTTIPYPPVSDVIAQMRSDSRMKSIPVLFSQGFETKGNNKNQLIRLAGFYRNVTLVDQMLTEAALKEGLGKVLASADTQVLSAEEKKKQAKIGMDWLRRIALGEKPGYAIAPAATAVREALNDADLASSAIEAAAAIPNKELQQDLANLFLNAGLPLELRLKAGDSLIRQLQSFGSGLAANQLQTLNDLLKTEANPQVKGKLTAILGVLQSNSKLTGASLQGYFPKMGEAK